MGSRIAGSLLTMLAEIPDPRRRQGLRYPLAAMLAAIVCGVLSGGRGNQAIAEWVRCQDASVCLWLGFRRKPPCANTFRNLLLALPPELLENVGWLRSQMKLPICIGFGVSTPEHVKPLAPVADGLIVGSAIVRRVADAAKRSRAEVLREVGDYVAELVAAL